MVTLRVLGAAVAVPAELAARLGSFPVTDASPDAGIDSGSVPVALAELTRLAVLHSPLLCVHAGVVSGPDGLIVVPGESGLGKTTLIAALLRAGFGYLSDEALAIDRATGAVTPFPRPLSLHGDVWPLLGLGPVGPSNVERLVPPGELGRIDGTGRVREVVLARRAPGPPRLDPAPRGDAVPALLRRAFNHYRSPEASFRCVVAVVREARVWRARYAEAPQLARLLRERLDHSAAATASR